MFHFLLFHLSKNILDLRGPDCTAPVTVFGLVGLLRHLIYMKTSSFEISQVSGLEVISVISGK